VETQRGSTQRSDTRFSNGRRQEVSEQCHALTNL